MEKPIKRVALLMVSLLMIIVFCSQITAQDERDKTTTDEIQKLRKSFDELKRTIEEQDRKIEDLEKKQSETEMEQKKPVGDKSPIRYRRTFDDKQTQAPRLDDYTMDPEYQGFIPVPNTDWMVKFNARPRVDITYNNRTPGDDDRFVTAKIPVKGQLEYDREDDFNINSRATHLSFEARAPELPGDPRFFYENDFFGSGDNEYEYRIKHLYGKIYNVVIGHTYSVFEDPDIWPDTVDFEGPNSMIFARWPLVQYLHAIDDEWTLKVGVEQPDSTPSNYHVGATVEDVDGINSAPDGGFNIRWAREGVGHAQFGAIFRYLGAKSQTFGNDHTFGWGTNLSGHLDVFEKDTILAQLTYGEGIGRYGNDTSFENSDIAYDRDGDLQALSYFGAFVGYTHHWSDDWRSTATYGFVNLGNEASQGPDAYDTTDYASLNLIWQVRPKLSIGLECLYGRRDVQETGVDGDLLRVQMGLLYTLF